jgi:hypothetical protein
MTGVRMKKAAYFVDRVGDSLVCGGSSGRERRAGIWIRVLPVVLRRCRGERVYRSYCDSPFYDAGVFAAVAVQVGEGFGIVADHCVEV